MPNLGLGFPLLDFHQYNKHAKRQMFDQNIIYI